MRERPTPEVLLDGILRGDRAALGRAISLIESRLPEDQARAQTLLDLLPPSASNTVRIGITGPPGAGKSSFIERLGLELCRERDAPVAVLAIDPSSPESGGSVLGDKTRMEELSREPRAFIRPSPSSGLLGGVARHSAELVRLCEAAGYRYLFIETVGVGQSEYQVRELCDVVVLLLLTGSGDQLQALKRGIMETADLIVIHKADGINAVRARSLALEVRQALGMRTTGKAFTKVMTASSLPDVPRSESGIAEIIDALDAWVLSAKAGGGFEAKRKEQMERRIRHRAEEALLEAFQNWLNSKPFREEIGLQKVRESEKIRQWMIEFAASLRPDSRS